MIQYDAKKLKSNLKTELLIS